MSEIGPYIRNNGSLVSSETCCKGVRCDGMLTKTLKAKPREA